MIGKKQQEGGDMATQVQGNGNTVQQIFNISMNSENAKDILVSLFESSYPELLDNAKTIAKEEITRLVGNFLQSITQTHTIEELAIGMSNQSTLYAFYEAQKSYVFTESEEKKQIIETLLIDLVSEKISGSKESTKELALLETLTLIKKLNEKHLSILALLLYLKNLSIVVKAISIEEQGRIIQTVFDLFQKADAIYSDQSRLISVGCVVIYPGMDTVEQLLHRGYGGVFQKGISLELYESIKSINGIDKIIGLRSESNDYVFKFQKFDDFNKEKYSFSDEDFSKLKNIFTGNTMNTIEIRELLTKSNNKFESYLQKRDSYMGHLNLTPLGMLLGSIYGQKTHPLGCVPIDDLFK